MFDIHGYGELINDAIRTDAYVSALRAVVKPGAVVLDIGTGTGMFALVASQLGARRVFAIEPNPLVQAAREIAAANGLADRIEFFQAMSVDVLLPESVDVIVSDLHGVTPFDGDHLPTIIDARRRFLAPGGVLIPGRDSLWLAVVEAPELHASVTHPWVTNRYGLDMRAGRDLAANTWCRAVVKPDQLLTEPACCGVLDYATIETPDFRAEIDLPVRRSGLAHGFCFWFDTTLADGIGISNAPSRPEVVYGNAYFRWPEAVSLSRGDTVSVSLTATPIGGEIIWTWSTTVLHSVDPTVVKAAYRQSTFFGKPMTIASLRAKAEGHVPWLTQDGEIDRQILQLMSEGLPLGDIARCVAARFPTRFPRWQDALGRAGDLSSKYGRQQS